MGCMLILVALQVSRRIGSALSAAGFVDLPMHKVSAFFEASDMQTIIRSRLPCPGAHKHTPCDFVHPLRSLVAIFSETAAGFVWLPTGHPRSRICWLAL